MAPPEFRLAAGPQVAPHFSCSNLMTSLMHRPNAAEYRFVICECSVTPVNLYRLW